NVTIVGCGDIGQRVAQRWLTQGFNVSGIVSSQNSLKNLKIHGVRAHQVDLDLPEPGLPPVSEQSLIYYFVPPPSLGIKDTRVQHFLSELSKQSAQPRRVIAISTTGVYGDCGGEKVTEDKIPNPMVDRARRRYDMESQLKLWCEQHDVELVILRVGGIYGPKRLPLKRIREGTPVLLESLAPKTNRIHQEDLADICVAAAKVDTRFRVYNVSDGTDSNMTEYFFKLADHFKLPRPPAVDWQEAERTISKGMLSYLKESRRVDNSRMLKELDIRLRYPNLEAGLSEINPDDSIKDS
ncbi:MAG: NAD-dependent epimerase/dehydratase family protein, partial [Thioalkalispiraceae bacterium]